MPLAKAHLKGVKKARTPLKIATTNKVTMIPRTRKIKSIRRNPRVKRIKRIKKIKRIKRTKRTKSQSLSIIPTKKALPTTTLISF